MGPVHLSLSTTRRRLEFYTIHRTNEKRFKDDAVMPDVTHSENLAHESSTWVSVKKNQVILHKLPRIY
jgi:hypothetical protein